MTSVPIEASDVERFTPPSLANLPAPPVILLKAGTRRERTLRDRRLKDRRARFHSQDRIRAAILDGLAAHWDAATAARFVPVVKSYWDAADQHERAVREAGDGEAPDFVFDGPTSEADILAMLDRLRDVDDRYNAMLSDNESFVGEATVATMVFVIAGWEGLDAEFRKVAGEVTDASIDALAAALMALEEDPANASVEGLGAPGTALMQLAAKCGERMFLTETARKNSSSPAPSSTSPEPSNQASAALGKSTAQASSKPTPATS